MAHRNYIIAKFKIITFMMMIVCSFFITLETSAIRSSWHTTKSNALIDQCSSRYFYFISNRSLSISFFRNNSTRFRVFCNPNRCLGNASFPILKIFTVANNVIGFVVARNANFALRSFPKKSSQLTAKIFNRFSISALRTGFDIHKCNNTKSLMKIKHFQATS